MVIVLHVREIIHVTFLEVTQMFSTLFFDELPLFNNNIKLFFFVVIFFSNLVSIIFKLLNY